MSPALRIGELAIHRIVEMQVPFTDPYEFMPGLTPGQLESNRGWMQDMGALDPATGRLVLCFQSYIVRTGKHVILVDSCVGNDKDRAARPVWHMKKDDAWMRGLAALGLTVADIDIVMCTHLHADHVGWNTTRRGEGWEPTFAHATYFASEGELAWGAEQFSVDRAFNYGSYADSVLPLLQADVLTAFSSQHHFDDRVTARTRSGHTPGSTVVHVRGRRDTMVLSGDVIHHPVQGRRPELCSRFCVDNSSSAKTRVEVLRIAASRNHILAPAHFPWGRVRSADDGQFTFHALN